MPVQQQNSSFAKKLGGRLAQANAEFAGKPPELRRKQLPANIRNGVAKLSTMYTKEQDKEDGACPKGEVFFRASAVVISPAEYAGCVTQYLVPMCDIPEKKGDGYTKPAIPFKDNWNKLRSLIESLGVAPFPEPPFKGDPNSPEAVAQGLRIEQYYFAATAMLTSPERMKTNPVYIDFSTRGFTPKKTIAKPDPTEMVFEDWHGPAKWDGKVDPAAGVGRPPPSTNGPPAYSAPPTAAADGLPPGPPPAHHAPTQVATAPVHPYAPLVQSGEESDLADVVAALVEVAMNDPDGATSEGADASAQLEKLAWAAGWSTAQTASPPEPFTNDWAGVGDMALTPPTQATQTTTAAPVATSPVVTPSASDLPVVGGKHRFAKRTKDGARLKDGSGNEFPPQDVEVVTVDPASDTCTLKTVKDGKMVVDIRTKQPVAVKFGWLE